MTAVTDRTGATDEEFQARIAAFEGADEPAEVTVEKVARAIHAADEVGNYPSTCSWEDDAEENREDYRRLAAAAIAAMPVRPDVTRTMRDVAGYCAHELPGTCPECATDEEADR